MTEPAVLDQVFVRLGGTNPFLDNRINGPAPSDVDVPAVHQPAFARLTELAGEALSARRALGAVLWGEAGIGKSHVLARLGRWAAEGNACFVYLHNLQAAPEQLPRSLLNNVISLLTLGRRDRFQVTPLFQLVRAGLVEAIEHKPGSLSWSQILYAYNRLLDRWGAEAGATAFDRTVYEVLFAFFRSAWQASRGEEDGTVANLAVRWLSGRGLDSAEGKLLGLPPPRSRDEAVALENTEQVRQVLVALTRLAACKGQAFVLAFDQVDNLERDQFAALARFLEALLDTSPNLLVVTAGIQPTLLGWRDEGVIQRSAWDRVTQFELLLQRLSAPQAEQLVRSRLAHFFAPFAEVDELARLRRADALFPLGQGWRQRTLGDKFDVRPRDAINWAREGWRQEQAALRAEGPAAWLESWPVRQGMAPPPPPPVAEDAAIDRAVAEALAKRRAELEEPGALPIDRDHLIGALYRVLAQCCEAGQLYGICDVEHHPAPNSGTPPTYDLELRQQAGESGELRVAVLVLAQQHGVAVTAALRRLAQAASPPDRLFLITDERAPLKLGDKGREYLRELRNGGPDRFLRIPLTVEENAQLNALQAVGRATDIFLDSGTGEARPLQPSEVISSLHRQGAYLASRPLRELLAGRPAELVSEPEPLAQE
jgi:hypothetical protein